MNWEAIGAVGEVVGAAAVVGTIVFLVLQVRQNTIALQQQSARESTSSIQQVSLKMMEPEVSDVISKTYQGAYSDLTPAELAKLEHWMMAYLLVFQQDFIDWKSGLHTPTTWESRIPLIKGIFVSTWARDWWDRIGHDYVTPEFQKVIDEILSEEPRDQGAYWKRMESPDA